uniref:ZP domain-containing protein n=1 Tax=Panagrolaimus sp. JU765 TaxID=591449 RepID=A0AC34RJX4_9BILA
MLDRNSVDNNVEGEPEIECGAQGIQITFNTRNPFNGRLYVKGHHDEGDCKNEQIGRAVTGITLNFDTCGVQRLRSLNPRGIFALTTIVISFHPIFVTKVDRIYSIQCFYMEAEKTVARDIQVSDLTTAFITQLVPMPICRYEILDGGPSGKPVQFAVVGQQVYHSFKCESETTDTFCMVVHSCVVDDGKGDKVEMLDAAGCAHDKFVLNNLEYPADLMAGQEAHVFKYADRSHGVVVSCFILLLISATDAITVEELLDGPLYRAASYPGRSGVLKLCPAGGLAFQAAVQLVCGISDFDQNTATSVQDSFNRRFVEKKCCVQGCNFLQLSQLCPANNP